MVSQISLVMLLLITASLFVRSLLHLQSIPLGFNPDNLLLFELNAPQAGIWTRQGGGGERSGDVEERCAIPGWASPQTATSEKPRHSS